MLAPAGDTPRHEKVHRTPEKEMATSSSTQADSVFTPGPEQKAVPGVLLVFSHNVPLLRAIPVTTAPLVIGREDAGGAPLPDPKVSKPHARFSFDGPGWTVEDLGSKNGTAVDGQVIKTAARGSKSSVVRMGSTLVLLCDDIRRFLVGAVHTDDKGMVVGPTLKASLDRIAAWAREGKDVLVTGESGAGKELAARSYYEGTGGKGPFVPVNCPDIQPSLAERLIFGIADKTATAVRAAPGFFEMADGGTLQLDELGDIALEVQANLLRVLQDRVVRRLGGETDKKVSVRIVYTTNRDLRAAIAEGTFRADLYYRISASEERLPALRDRREEIPWLIAETLSSLKVRVPHATLVEETMLRAWPGNTRELVKEIRAAAESAHAAGSATVRREHLSPQAGRAAASAGRAADAVTASAPAAPAPKDNKPAPTREEIERALATAGSVAAAARQLGLHRTQLYRFMERHGLIRPDGEADDEH
jgi:transcriptional regulator of acetoin/glycerol metabolism